MSAALNYDLLLLSPSNTCTAASTEIAAVADHINEHIRQHENFNKMLSIQNSLTGNCVPGILAPGRKFLQEGRLMKVCCPERSSFQLFRVP